MNTNSFADLPLGTHLHFQSVDSTNTAAKRIRNLSEPDVLPILITCDQQTAGRGRGSNRWIHAAGNLAFSVIIDRRTLPDDASHFLGLWTALCLLRCAQHYLPNQLCQIKWPNDLMIDQRKNAGILIESISESNTVVCGIGINLVHLEKQQKEQIENPVFAWAEAENAEAWSRESILRNFLTAWLKLDFQSEPERLRCLAEIQKRDWLSGKAVEVTANGKTWQGTYRGLTAEGHLQLSHAAPLIQNVLSSEKANQQSSERTTSIHTSNGETDEIMSFASCDRVRPLHDIQR